MNINKEKQEIIEAEGNILVTANPGTGKTLLLAHKYVALVDSGVEQQKILCLTFTEKAKREMEERILKMNEEQECDIDPSKLNVFTFHSFALNNLESRDIVTSNLLRFSIYLYVKEKKFFSYGNSYILDKIVPKIENLIRYLKSFGVKPNDIDFEKSAKFLKEENNISPKELQLFLKHFIEIYRYYESVKSGRGYDYADLLIEYLKLKNKPQYEFVLVDELQDVNKMEADIALESAKNFVAVGDKKQAIFGFQGGSILNFEAFSGFNKAVLSDNFRSTNEILNYSKEYFISKTSDDEIIDDLKELKNADDKTGDNVAIVEIDKSVLFSVAEKFLLELSKTDGKTAVILRTNTQISQLSKELEARGINFSSTHLSGSDEAKDDIILFIKGVLSNDIRLVKNSMFSSFFPLTIQKAFDLAKVKHEKPEDFLKECPEFSELRKRANNSKKVKDLFNDYIIPISLTYGKDYFITAKKLADAFIECFTVLEEITFNNVIDYLESTDLSTEEIEEEGSVVLTTVHKSKGREYENVIYLPTQQRDHTNFIDNAVKAILCAKGINVDEELEEETLRVNFVAFTRAKEKLIIISDKASDYQNEFSEIKNVEQIVEDSDPDLNESEKNAFTFFVNKNFEKAKSLLHKKDDWLVDYISNHFEQLISISYTSVNYDPFKYLKENILGIREFSDQMLTGSEVHKAAENLLNGEIPQVSKEALPFVENIKTILGEIKIEYPEVFEVEKLFDINLNEICDEPIDIRFRGKIDAIFKNDDSYLIVDWKTNRDTSKSSDYRRQLECYRRAFCEQNFLDPENVDIAIAYTGLRSPVSADEYKLSLERKKPGKNVFNTFLKHVNVILGWKANPQSYLDQLLQQKKSINENLWRAVIEQYLLERNNSPES